MPNDPLLGSIARDSITGLAPGEFWAHYRRKGHGAGGHRQPNMEFHFGDHEIPEGSAWAGIPFPSFVRRYHSVFKKYEHFYQGEGAEWLFIEFWISEKAEARNREKLMGLLEEICTDLQNTFGLKRIPVPETCLYDWERPDEKSVMCSS